MNKKKFKKDNKDFMVLSAICILFVVDAHSGGGFKILNNLFPYDSFFMPAFVFISGYFYKFPSSFVGCITFFRRKIKTLLMPFYKYNFGITLLWFIPVLLINKSLLGTNSLSKDSFTSFHSIFDLLYNKLIVVPFSYGTPFDLISPAWFLISLFGTIIGYTVIKAVLNLITLKNNAVLLIFLSSLGLMAVWLSKLGYSNKVELLLILKIMFFLPFFYLGDFISSLDREGRLSESNYKKMAIISIIVNFILLFFYSPREISFSSLAFMQSFKSIPMFIPFVTAITGIFFYLYVSKLIAKIAGENYWLNLLSENTLTILCLHMFCFNIVNLIFSILSDRLSILRGFNKELFFSSAWYIYTPSVGFCFLYFIMGVFVPLLYVLLKENLSIALKN